MRRRIQPNPGHALFFPNRKHDQVVIGQTVLFWPWALEEYKHIQLGDFKITIQFGTSTNPPVKTADDLPCRIHSVFRIKVNHDSDSLAKATRTFSPSKDISRIVSHDFFERDLEGKLEALIETATRQLSYIELLTTLESAIELENAIRTMADTRMTDMGFTLIGCRVDVEPIAPNPEALAQNTRLKELWSQRLDIKGRVEIEELKRSNAEAEAKKREENRSQLAKDEEEKNNQIGKQLVVNKREEELRKLKIIDENSNRINKDELAKISSAMKKIDEEAQKEKIRYETDLERYEQEMRAELEKEKLNSEHERQKLDSRLNFEREQYQQERRFELDKTDSTHRLNMSKLKRDEEIIEWQHTLSSEENELKSDELKVKRAELQQAIISAEKNKIEELGKAKAEIERLMMLATHAYSIEINKSFLDALPAILEKAYVPSEKLGEVKVMYIGGRTSDSGDGTQVPVDQPLSSILSSMSTLPMVREILKFLGSWELPMTQAFDHTLERVNDIKNDGNKEKGKN